jgi:hypothetical protein
LNKEDLIMPNDTTLNAHAFGAGSAKATIPTLDRQQTNAGASAVANLVKQRMPYVSKPPVFQGDTHTLYGPLPAMITPWDTYIDVVSWSAAGGLDEVVEIQNAAGQTVWRGTSQSLDDSNFACVRVGRVAVGGYKVPTMDSGRLDITIGRIPRNR